MPDDSRVTKINHFYNGQSEGWEAQPHYAADDLVRHDELPEGCTTLTEGARRYGIPVRRMRNLVSNCRLTKMGYLRGKGPQGGSLLLLEAEVAALDEAVVPETAAERRAGTSSQPTVSNRRSLFSRIRLSGGIDGSATGHVALGCIRRKVPPLLD